MNTEERVYGFDSDTLEKMDEFGKDFERNKFKKDTSVNKGPNYREKIMEEDNNVFFDYLESEFSDEFLKIK